MSFKPNEYWYNNEIAEDIKPIVSKYAEKMNNIETLGSQDEADEIYSMVLKNTSKSSSKKEIYGIVIAGMRTIQSKFGKKRALKYVDRMKEIIEFYNSDDQERKEYTEKELNDKLLLLKYNIRRNEKKQESDIDTRAQEHFSRQEIENQQKEEPDEITEIEKELDQDDDEIKQIEKENDQDDEIEEEKKNEMEIENEMDIENENVFNDDIYHTDLNDIPHEQSKFVMRHLEGHDIVKLIMQFTESRNEVVHFLQRVEQFIQRNTDEKKFENKTELKSWLQRLFEYIDYQATYGLATFPYLLRQAENNFREMMKEEKAKISLRFKMKYEESIVKLEQSIKMQKMYCEDILSTHGFLVEEVLNSIERAPSWELLDSKKPAVATCRDESLFLRLKATIKYFLQRHYEALFKQQEEIRALSNKLDQLESVLESSEKKKYDLTMQNEQLQAALGELSINLNTKNTLVENLKKECNELIELNKGHQARITKLISSLNIKDREIENVREENNKLQSTLKDIMESGENKRNELVLQNQRIRERVEALNMNLAAKDREVEKVVKEVNQLHIVMKDVNESNENKQKKLILQNRRLNMYVTMKDSKVKQLKKENERLHLILYKHSILRESKRTTEDEAMKHLAHCIAKVLVVNGLCMRCIVEILYTDETTFPIKATVNTFGSIRSPTNDECLSHVVNEILYLGYSSVAQGDHIPGYSDVQGGRKLRKQWGSYGPYAKVVDDGKHSMGNG